MPPETLDFEEPIGVLLKEIEALSMMPKTDARQLEIDSLKRRIESIRGELYEHLTPWQRVLVARHPNRPGLEDYIQRLFPGFIEIHGDRRFADDHAIMTGFADYHGEPVLLVGHVKGRDTKEKIYRNFGYARPVPGHRVRGARRRGGDCGEPPRHDAARNAGHRHRERGRRQRRSTGDRDWRQDPHAGVRHLQRHSARG